jgi:hypothetical protein
MNIILITSFTSILWSSKTFSLFRDLYLILVQLLLLVAWSWCFIGLKVSKLFRFWRLLWRWMTFEYSIFILVDLDMCKTLFLFHEIILNSLVLEIFFLGIGSFFFALTLSLLFRSFRWDLSLSFFLIVGLVIRGLNLNVMLHAFFQETFLIKGLEHLDQRANVIVVHQIFLTAKRLNSLQVLSLSFFIFLN